MTAAMLLGFCAGFAATSHAATYYVSAAVGDDARPATQAQTPDQPWRTLQRAADAMQPGDICLVGGGTYRETVRVKADGVTFVAREGEVPVVSGCDVISGSTRHTDKIFRAAVKTRVLAVFENVAARRISALTSWAHPPGRPDQP